MNLYIYEDDNFGNFSPLSTTRPVFLLRSGMYGNHKRIARRFEAEIVGLACREQLATAVARKITDLPVNIVKRDTDRVLFVNGRLREPGDIASLVEKSKQSCLFRSADSSQVVAVLLRSELIAALPAVTTPAEYADFVRNAGEEITEFETSATLFEYCWDFVDEIGNSVVQDFEENKPYFRPAKNLKVHDGSHFINGDYIYLADGVEIMPGAVVDASEGPVFIGPGSKIEPHAAIFGPCFIGSNCRVLAGKISGSSIGSFCRVGGEIEASIFQSNVNKYHDGFIGHSYVGSWVNFGAMTTNSDLKNNYSDIRLVLNGQAVDSGSIKVGSFIGDHTKFGIGTLLNTGINIGASCNLFGGRMIADKEIKPFSWGDGETYTEYDFDKAIDTARVVCSRRGEKLDGSEIDILRALQQDRISKEGALDFG
ncbi:MAG: putative sugar nucleotidyl transferase [bacterium]|nr:putative sugar nucleotidyl transferase [bacterium]